MFVVFSFSSFLLYFYLHQVMNNFYSRVCTKTTFVQTRTEAVATFSLFGSLLPVDSFRCIRVCSEDISCSDCFSKRARKNRKVSLVNSCANCITQTHLQSTLVQTVALPWNLQLMFFCLSEEETFINLTVVNVATCVITCL